jgi:hypothetical protein
MNPDSSMTDAWARQASRRRHVTGAAITFGGLAVIAIGAVVMWSWQSRLPNPIASHWGVGGKPDGFSSLGEMVGVLLGIGGGIVLAFGAFTWALGQSAVSRRIGAAATAWAAIFLTIVVVGTLYVQLDLPDARDVGDVNGVLLVAILSSAVLAILVAVVVPGDKRLPTTAAVASDAPRVRLLEGERATWIGRASSPVAFLIGAPVLVLSVVLVVLLQAWVMLVIAAVVLLALTTLSSFVIRVDRDGLTVRSSLGWPRYRVPLDEVLRADVTQVSPVKDFGGWGWRVGRDGRVGVVLRKGESLLVERTGGRSIVVTVDGATSAAGLLNALADRGRRAS